VWNLHSGRELIAFQHCLLSFKKLTKNTIENS
jgi:hypothetical protein